MRTVSFDVPPQEVLREVYFLPHLLPLDPLQGQRHRHGGRGGQLQRVCGRARSLQRRRLQVNIQCHVKVLFLLLLLLLLCEIIGITIFQVK